MTSQQGVQQGDPLGPLLFCLGWHDVIQALPSSLQVNLWYLDDGHLVGNVDQLHDSLEAIQVAGERLGCS